MSTRVSGYKIEFLGVAAGLLIIASTAAAIVGVQANAASNDTLDARLQKLADQDAIRDLLLEYGRLFDHYDFDGYSKLFSENGVWSGPLGNGQVVATGPEEIKNMLVKAMGTPKYDASHVTGFHLMTNFLIHVDGDRATALSKWTYFSRTKDNKLVAALAGHYDDTLIRVDGHWKFLHRDVARDIPNL